MIEMINDCNISVNLALNSPGFTILLQDSFWPVFSDFWFLWILCY